MAWVYHQRSGRLLHGGKYMGYGYSGKDAGKDNPVYVTNKGIGPIPAGRYKIGKPFIHHKAGPGTMRLTPEPGTNTFGRDGFLIHGDSKTHPGRASEGCIILGILFRQSIWKSGDDELEVQP
jgi:hypothetical protein